jgi:hypothetical protein
MRFSVQNEHLFDLIKVLVSWFGVPNQERGLWGYEKSYRWPSSLMVVFNGTRVQDENRAMKVFAVEVPGDLIQSWDEDFLKKFMGWISSFPLVKCTRLDVFIDDMDRVSSIAMVRKAWKQKQVWGFGVSGNYDKSGCGGEKTVDAITFGSRGKSGSGKFLRVYDKNLESCGVNKSIRYEVEFSDERSDQGFRELMMCVPLGNLSFVAARLVLGAFGFFRKWKDGTAVEPLPWWKKICDGIDGIKLPMPVKISEIEDVKRWLMEIVSASFMMVREFYMDRDVGDVDEWHKWLSGFWEEGRRRMRQGHWAKIQKGRVV